MPFTPPTARRTTLDRNRTLARAGLAGLGLLAFAACSAPPRAPQDGSTDLAEPTAVSFAITGLSDGATVAGSLNPGPGATQDGGIHKVSFLLLGPGGATVLERTDNSAPFCLVDGPGTTCAPWNSVSVANGTYALTATGSRRKGNMSATATFTVSNAAPSLTSTASRTLQHSGLGNSATTISDPNAAGGEAARLGGTGSYASFALPADLAAGDYSVQLRARGDQYQGAPNVAVVIGGTRVGSVDLDSTSYATKIVGTLSLTPGATVAVEFTNNLYDGSPDKDRNAYVDELILAATSAAPAPAPEPAPEPEPEPAPAPEPTPPSAGLVGDWYVSAAAAAGGDGSTTAPFRTIGEAVSRASNGQTVVVRPGTYRESVTVGTALTLVGEPGATVKGSDVWTSWTQEGTYWTRPYSFTWQQHGMCRSSSNGRCRLADQVFVDGIPQFQETALASVGSGDFWVGNGKLYLGSDPAGRSVEVTTRDYWVRAASSSVHGVTIRGFAMRHAANRAQVGAISDGNANGWVVRDNDLSLAHGYQVQIRGDNALVENNRLTDSGQMNLGGSGTNGLVVRGNYIARANTEDFERDWEAGGMKFSFSNNALFENNEAERNDGPGLWCDIDCGTTGTVTFRGNRVHHNAKQGISYEISGPTTDQATTSTCLIEGNAAWENGHYQSGFEAGVKRPWGWGAGILVQNSSGCVVRNNTVAWNADGISVIQQCRGEAAECGSDRSDSSVSRVRVYNVNVHDNVIVTRWTGNQSMLLAWLSDITTDRLYDLQYNNRGTNNRYAAIAVGSSLPNWEWNGALWSLSSFNSTPGEENGVAMSDTEVSSALLGANMPLSPEF